MSGTRKAVRGRVMKVAMCTFSRDLDVENARSICADIASDGNYPDDWYLSKLLSINSQECKYCLSLLPSKFKRAGSADPMDAEETALSTVISLVFSDTSTPSGATPSVEEPTEYLSPDVFTCVACPFVGGPLKVMHYPDDVVSLNACVAASELSMCVVFTELACCACFADSHYPAMRVGSICPAPCSFRR